MKRIVVCLLLVLLLTSPVFASAQAGPAVDVPAPSAVLMERRTGKLLYEKNAYEHLSPASVTKVMTMLLVAEAVDRGELSLEDTVTASARAASMGGSQIWLEEGERMSVGEMLKCVAVVSANDCCVALAEHLSGTEEACVAEMNRRAGELGMADTHFLSCSGLNDSDGHYSCARDIAVMSRELLGHDLIRNYTTIWMDSIRGGEFGLSNTNKLIYYYPGATGLKTGFTSKAMFCLSASAERDGVEYIAVVLHAPSSAERFDSAKTLLSYGFANYTLVSPEGKAAIPPVLVRRGAEDCVEASLPPDAALLLEKRTAGELQYAVELPETVNAPVEPGQELGQLTVSSGDAVLQVFPLTASSGVERLSVWRSYGRLLLRLVGAGKSTG